MTIASLTVEYQILLEHHRRDPDDAHIWELLVRTRTALDEAWLEWLVR